MYGLLIHETGVWADLNAFVEGGSAGRVKGEDINLHGIRLKKVGSRFRECR